MEGEEKEKGEPDSASAEALEKARKQLAEERRKREEVENKLSEHAQEQERLAQEQERSKGEFSKIEERYQKMLEDLRAENAELMSFKSGVEKGRRRKDMLQRVAEEADVDLSADLKALWLLAEQDGKVSLPTEGVDPSKTEVKRAVEALKKYDSLVFKSEGTKRPLPKNGQSPGSGQAPKDSDYWARKARSYPGNRFPRE